MRRVNQKHAAKTKSSELRAVKITVLTIATLFNVTATPLVFMKDVELELDTLIVFSTKHWRLCINDKAPMINLLVIDWGFLLLDVNCESILMPSAQG